PSASRWQEKLRGANVPVRTSGVNGRARWACATIAGAARRGPASTPGQASDRLVEQRLHPVHRNLHAAVVADRDPHALRLGEAAGRDGHALRRRRWRQNHARAVTEVLPFFAPALALEGLVCLVELRQARVTLGALQPSSDGERDAALAAGGPVAHGHRLALRRAL